VLDGLIVRSGRGRTISRARSLSRAQRNFGLGPTCPCLPHELARADAAGCRRAAAVAGRQAGSTQQASERDDNQVRAQPRLARRGTRSEESRRCCCGGSLSAVARLCLSVSRLRCSSTSASLSRALALSLAASGSSLPLLLLLLLLLAVSPLVPVVSAVLVVVAAAAAATAARSESEEPADVPPPHGRRRRRTRLDPCLGACCCRGAESLGF